MIAFAAVLLAQAQLPVAVEAIAVGAEERIAGLCTGDLDGDGRPDLVLAVADADDSIELRGRLRGGDGRLVAEPAWRRDLPSDVTAFAVGDLSAAPGGEVLLLGGTGAFALAPDAPEQERFSRIAPAEFLWQVPVPGRLLPWANALVDLDDDGVLDLLLPESKGYRVARQTVSPDGRGWDEGVRLDLESLEAERKAADTGFDLSIEIAGEGASAGARTLATVVERVGAPWIGDWEGDGRTDVAGLVGNQLRVWRGASPQAPPLELELPLEVDLERRLDLSWALHLGDVSGDGRADAVMVARDPKGAKDRTQVLVYTDLEAGFERPTQALIVDGLVGDTRLVDVDGDGLLDLVVTAIREDFLDAIRSGGIETVRLDLYVYPSRGGRLAKSPALRHGLEFPAEQEPFYLFCADVSGEGGLDLMVRTAETRLEIFYVRVRGDAWTVPERSLWQRGIGAEATVERLAGGDPLRHFALVEETQATLLEVGR